MLQLFDSKFNGKIKVKKYLWETSVWVGGFEQSGPLVEQVWKKALKNISAPKKVLILGLGCGVAAKLITKKFPKTKITGIEIDPIMIDIGKKYFDLPKIKIEIVDAFKFVKTAKQKYDLILVDIYSSGKLPYSFDQKFLNNLKNILSKNGEVIFNYLKFGKLEEEKVRFFQKIHNNFKSVETVQTEYNTLFYAALSKEFP